MSLPSEFQAGDMTLEAVAMPDPAPAEAVEGEKYGRL
jgi:hypothetical protein